MNLRNRVGLNIQYLRRKRGVSQEELAHLAGINRGYLGKLENANNSATLDTLEKIAVALDMDPIDLLAEHQFIRHEVACDFVNSNPHVARRFREGIVFENDKKVVVWTEYAWNNGKVMRFWTKGIAAIPEYSITVREIAP